MKERPIEIIPLTQDRVAIIDGRKFSELSEYKWWFNGGYAYSRINGRLIAMHVFLMSTPKGMHTDHINHNTLDNRLENLRVVTPKENILHRRSYNSEGNPFFGKTHTKEFKETVRQRWSIPVVQFSMDNVFVATFPSASEAERKTGISNGNISSVCIGKRLSAGGFKWMHQ